MVSKDEKVYMEMVFTRDCSVSRQEKVKALWKFLDTRDDLQPHKGTLEVKTPPQTKSSTLSMNEKDIWRKGLGVFQQLGLDKTALAADNRCKLCLMEKMIECKDLADTVTQPYEELNAEMKAFQQRQKNRILNQSKKLVFSNTLNQRGSDCAETKKL
ncbi:uncharacterized protein LOC116846542 [Odontomachus brunneus]|uniref:uncharacterized protein LOC116846542 n=1 Tax=Odontomachus brunneus TaxID=486640 RepID=UPI0013F190E6|nr:uncharacterized protein LOC116846542 [Odontomachus brunneus]